MQEHYKFVEKRQKEKPLPQFLKSLGRSALSGLSSGTSLIIDKFVDGLSTLSNFQKEDNNTAIIYDLDAARQRRAVNFVDPIDGLTSLTYGEIDESEGA